MSAILICDGNPTSLDELTQILTAEDYDVGIATEVCGVLRMLLRRPYSVLILSSSLNGINVSELLPITRQIDAELPVIVVSETSSLETERQLRTNQLFYYLVKPIDHAEILAVVRQAVLKRSRQPSPACSRFPVGMNHSTPALR